MKDNNSATDSVTSVVTSNVTSPKKSNTEKSIGSPKRRGGNIRHVTGTRYGWTYQRRLPRDLGFSSSEIIFKKRLGARSKSEVRRLATAFDMLLDGVFGVVKVWKVKTMTIVDDLGLEPWQKDYIIHRMRVGVEHGVREIAKNGYKTPGLESQIITKAIDNIDKDLLELSQCKALSRQHQTVDMVSKLKARKLDIIWKNEMNKLDCELGVNLGHG